MSDPIRPCSCTHDIDDHQPIKDEVTETREECTECECEDFEEIATPCADCGRMDGGCDRTKEPEDMNCPKCGSPLINTLLPIGGNTYQTTLNCYECDIWWDYVTGRQITVTTIEEDTNG